MRLAKGWRNEVSFDVWPLEKDGVTTRLWYEDDGDSIKYRDGAYTQTAVSCETKGRELVFRIGPREGAFNGMPSSHRVTLRIHGKNAMAQPIDLGEVNAMEGVTHRTIRQ